MKHIEYRNENELQENLLPRFPLYSVTEDGKVFSRRHACGIRKRWKKLNPRKVKGGYLKVEVTSFDGKKKGMFVHRLVLLAFEGDSEMHCRHLDGNPQNNHISNLKYGTPKENAHDKFLHGTSGASFNEGQIKEIFALSAQGKTLTEIASIYKTTLCTILFVIYRKTYKHINIDPATLGLIKEKRTDLFKKLDKEKVLAIFKMRAGGMSHSEIAKHFGVKSNSICAVLNRKSWSHVEIPEDILLTVKEMPKLGVPRKITRSDWSKISDLFKGGVSVKEIALAYGISKAYVGEIISKENPSKKTK